MSLAAAGSFPCSARRRLGLIVASGASSFVHLPRQIAELPANLSAGSLGASSSGRQCAHLPACSPSLGSDVLFAEAQLSRMTGLCYRSFDQYNAFLEREGFHLVSCGDTYFTSWYIAKRSPNKEKSVQTENERDHLHVFLRGVKWRSAELNIWRVWQQLGRRWTRPLSWYPGLRGIQAHAGILEMASELEGALQPHLQGHKGPITFCGHSLGGTFAQLLALRSVASAAVHGPAVTVHTYGSPPALAYIGDSVQALQGVGMSRDQIRNWVLDYDPVPRYMTQSDLYIQLAMRTPYLRQMLEFGSKALKYTPRQWSQPAVLRSVGTTCLLSLGCGEDVVRIVDETVLDKALEIPIDKLLQKPVLFLQTVLDHTHNSYSHDLQVAARVRQGSEALEMPALAADLMSPDR